MKALSRLAFAVLAIGLSTSPAWAYQAPAAEPDAEAKPAPKPLLGKLELKDGDSIVFLGDSITHQVLYTQYVEDYFYTRYPKMRLKFHNAGVGGARAWDALQRFDKDGQTFYRARFGGFSDKDAANDMCKQLKQAKMSCLAMQS